MGQGDQTGLLINNGMWLMAVHPWMKVTVSWTNDSSAPCVIKLHFTYLLLLLGEQHCGEEQVNWVRRYEASPLGLSVFTCKAVITLLASLAREMAENQRMYTKASTLYTTNVECTHKLLLQWLNLELNDMGAHLFAGTDTEAFLEKGGLGQLSHQ